MLTNAENSFSSIIQGSYLFHVSHNQRLALEKVLLPLKDKDLPAQLETFFVKIQLDDNNAVDKIDPKLVKIFILAGLAFPDPFGLKPEESMDSKEEKSSLLIPTIHYEYDPINLAKLITDSYIANGRPPIEEKWNLELPSKATDE